MGTPEDKIEELAEKAVKETPFLFEEFDDHRHEEHWVGMPEYISKDCTPFRTLMIHFEDKESVEIFKRFIGQTITDQTKYLYFPKVNEKRCTIDKEYRDE